MKKKIKNIINRLKIKKWKLYLYYNGVLIKKVKVYREELTKLKEKRFVINVYFKKHLFGKNKANIIVSPVVLLETLENKRSCYVGVVLEKGQTL